MENRLAGLLDEPEVTPRNRLAGLLQSEGPYEVPPEMLSDKRVIDLGKLYEADSPRDIKNMLDWSRQFGLPLSTTNQYYDSIERVVENPPIGFREALREDPLYKVPFFGAAVEGADLWTLRETTIRLNDPYFDWERAAHTETLRERRQRSLKTWTGSELKARDEAFVTDYIHKMAQREERDYSTAGKIGLGLAILPAWMFEFAMTAGLYTGGKQATKNFLSKYMKSKVAKATAGWVAGSAVRTTVGMPHRVFAETMKQSVLRDEGWATSIAKGWGSAFIEAASEETGQALVGLTGKGLSKLPFGNRFLSELQKAWLKLAPENTAAEFAKRMATQAGYHGLLGEFGEERLATLLHAIAKTESFGLPKGASIDERLVAGLKQDFDASNLISEAVVLSVPGAVQVSIAQAGQYFTDKSLQKAIIDEVGVTPEQAKKAITLKNTAGPEVADQYLSVLKTAGELEANQSIAEQGEVAKAPETPDKAAPTTPAAPGQVKQPWEMTKEEYGFGAVTTLLKTPDATILSPEAYDVFQRALDAVKTEPIGGRAVDASKTTKEDRRALADLGLSGTTDRLGVPMMAISQRKQIDLTRKRLEHKKAVEKAVSENKPVPRNVLEEYKGEKWADEALAKLTPAAPGQAKQPSLTEGQEKALRAVAETKRDTGGAMAFDKFQRKTYEALQKKGYVHATITPTSASAELTLQGEKWADEALAKATPAAPGQAGKQKAPRKPKQEGFLGIPIDLPEPTKLRESAERIYQNYINRFAAIENTEKKAKALGLEVKPGESPTMLARGYLGMARKVEAMLENKTYIMTKGGTVRATGEGLKPILDSYDTAVKPLEANRKQRETDFNDYLIAVRTIEDLQRPPYEGAKENIVTPEQVAKAEADLDALRKKYGARIAELESHAQRLYEYQKRILHLLVDAGNLSQQRYDTIVRLNQHYIPFDRILEEENIAGGVPKKVEPFTKARAPVRKIKGSEKKQADPIESVIKNTYKIVNAAERNKVARAVARFGKVLPDDVTPIRVRMVPIKVSPKEIRTVTTEFRNKAKKVREEVETVVTSGGKDLTGPAKKLQTVVKEALTHRGFSEAEANSFIAQLQKAEGAEPGAVTKETIERTITETQRILKSEVPIETTIFRPSQFAPKGKVIEFFDKGKRKYVELAGNLHAAMTGLDETTAGLLVKIFAQPAHWLRVGATITPEFIARNPIRDQWTALMQTSFGFVPFVDSTGAIADILGQKDIYYEWLASGGAYAGFVELNRPALQKAVDELRHGKNIFIRALHPISVAQDLSQLMEMATRLGLYKAQKRMGKTSIEAGFTAREGTIDFARRGAKMADINLMMAFFNAGIQGLDKTIRSSITHPYQTAIKGLVSITLPSLLLYLRNRDDDEYKEMAQWKKDLFWNFKLGDTWFRVPKPFLFGQLYGSIPERFFEYLDSRDKKAFKGLKKSTYEALTPVSGDPESGLLFTAVKPIIENLANRNFFLQRPIVGEGREDLLPEDQYGRYTSEAAKQLGQWLNYSPAKIENLVRGYFGGTGRYALEGVDALANAIRNEQDEGRPKELADYPLVKGFVSRKPTGATAQSINDFYENTKKIERLYNSYHERLKDGRNEEARKIHKEHPEIDKYKTLNKIRIELSDLRKEADTVIASGRTKKQKEVALSNIDKKRLTLARNGNKIIGE